jgi:hypothetical protein
MTSQATAAESKPVVEEAALASGRSGGVAEDE